MEGSKEQLEREEANQERRGCKPKEMSSERDWSVSDEDPNVILRWVLDDLIQSCCRAKRGGQLDVEG